ncbi:MAG: hypothetical protein HOM25_10390 [Rhodospirillaceae bacterium]|jgi:hypothetical protein|nr:hypothetical protein [Rhodospirillaceae bacterium]MBT5664785.1 hypothetical protein [Rhodospirillaceae bacterium]
MLKRHVYLSTLAAVGMTFFVSGASAQTVSQTVYSAPLLTTQGSSQAFQGQRWSGFSSQNQGVPVSGVDSSATVQAEGRLDAKDGDMAVKDEAMAVREAAPQG